MADWEGFDVEGRLGVGTTGTVWLARQVSVGRLVALKELAPELADNQAVREHLRHEAQVLARLDDPNCVAVYSYLESASAAAIVMEYVEGVSLRTLTERGPLSVEQALSVLEGALSGLAAAHQQGIVHGDIKPENILLATSGESKLVDFGLAAAVGTRRAPGTGSPTYSSPEAAAGEPLGVTSDLYSAGLVLSELLAGVSPVGVDQASAAASLPAPVASLVSRALDPDPSARQTSARAFLDELRAAAEEGCGEEWRLRAVLIPIVVAAATGAVSALGVAKAGAATPLAASSTASAAARRTSKLGHLLHTHPWAAAAMAGVVVVAGVGAGVAAASGGGNTPPLPTPTAVVKPATASAAAPGITPTTMTPAQFENATLPAGTCGTDPDTPPIPMTDGRGQGGYWFAGIMGTPAQVNFGSGHAGLAVDITCSQGGSFEFSQAWVFDGTPSNPTVAYGPLSARSYNLGTFGIVGSNITDVRAAGDSLVVVEGFSGPDDCSGGSSTCEPGSNETVTTTWGLSPTDPTRLVITRPRPTKVTVTVATTPADLGGQPLTGRSAQKPVAVGQTVNAVCETRQLPPLQVELDTGAWVPASDLQAVQLPDCDAGAVASPSSTPSTTAATVPPSTTTPPSSSASDPGSEAAATAAAAQWYANGTDECEANPPGNPPPATPTTIPPSAIPVTWSQFTPDQSGTGQAGDAATAGPGGFTATYSNGTWTFTPMFNFC